jgi:hypothetical protein
MQATWKGTRRGVKIVTTDVGSRAIIISATKGKVNGVSAVFESQPALLKTFSRVSAERPASNPSNAEILSAAALWCRVQHAARLVPMDNRQTSPPADSFKLSVEGEMEFHKTLLSICEEISKQKKPHAPFAFNGVVPQKPMHLEEVRGRVRPEDFDSMKQSSPDGTGFFMIRKVWRDAVIDALVSKATATKMAVASLAVAGFGAEPLQAKDVSP